MRQWRDGDGAIGEEDIVFFLSQVVRGKIGGRKPATVAERIRAAGFTIEERQIVPVGAVVGAHVGRGACAITYIKRD